MNTAPATVRPNRTDYTEPPPVQSWKLRAPVRIVPGTIRRPDDDTESESAADLSVLGTVYAHCANGRIDAALEAIFGWCDEQFTHAAFESVRKTLRDVDVARIPGDVIVGWLSATFVATEHLGVERWVFATRARESLVREFGAERVQRIYARLGG